MLGLRLVAALLSLTILLGAGFAWAQYRRFTTDIPRVSAINASTRLASDVDGSASNILITGSDNRDTATDAELAALGTTRDGGSVATDTMMVLHVPSDGKKATAISFPRDSWVAIPGHGTGKLNSAYADGLSDGHGDKSAGARLLVQTIENLTGLTINHFAQVDLIGFYRISNAIGGITVCLNAAQNASTEGDAQNPDGYSGINLKKGINVIKGKQALAFVRQRHGLPQGDLDRIVRQQYFLSAVFRKVTTSGTLLNPFKLTKLLKAVSSSITMDGNTPGHKGLDPLALAQQLQDLAAGNLTFTTIPTTSDFIDGTSIQRVDTEQLPVLIAGILGRTTTTAYAQAKTVDPGAVSVAVLNGTGAAGLASTNAGALIKAGFKTTIGDAASAATTSITYPGGMEAQAKTLAAYVPGATVVRSTSVSVVTLTLGADGLAAHTTKAAAATTPAKSTSAAAKTTAAPTTAPATTDPSARTASDVQCIN